MSKNKELNQIQFEYKNLSGETRKAFLTPLVRKEAAKVFHETLMSILVAIIGGEKGIELSSVVKALDFDKVWELGQYLLKNSMIDHTEITSIDDTDFFEDNPEELYIVLIKAVQENFPSFFTKLKGLTKDGFSGLSKLV